MDKIRIVGGRPLQGKVRISGSKNASLPVLISALVSGGECRFENVPDLQDIRTTVKLLSMLGCEVQDRRGSAFSVKAPEASSAEAPYDLVRTMRASVVVLGPLLARYGKAKVSLPGGCAIGARPIGFHLSALEKLGARFEIEQGYVLARSTPNGVLIGNRVQLEFPSVGATENVVMAAALARGDSEIGNCAKEPEIVDLVCALRAMGAEISGEGTDTIRVQGSGGLPLAGCSHRVMADRIEAGTFLAAAFATRGSVEVGGIQPQWLEAVLAKFEEAGARVERGPDWVKLDSQGNRARSVSFTTQPYPGFPTDMQAQFMALLCVAEGVGTVTETIFENRFMHVPELQRLGASIEIRGHQAVVTGRDHLTGAPVMATDLRASASLVIGGLCARGETMVNRVYHLDRGYERMEAKLHALGAEIERVRDERGSVGG